ncbi:MULTISPECIES: ADP-forming succinate--CoA ligase subunit beta [unclassified Actinomyces]|uniref:ADP-forming succinate--CoA ligase subunit beta n=1 Tax=unclassified Actinomyces TaxID=2609248 RepID=UPI002016F194|nr:MULTISPECIES: ADP-forming succinate--CoA ligase subunit beta [unclassified Actinomyces]MCL3778270.1 ADP-forming succinate--CoA ligase subunit beta [Actinomyces sp. AC-20-1]MCL3788732.1 ADP-forming succinate--CoA ligase subunit beta [Actinomyces sp. 187325]MCL3791794.1 ADP-forming succinate--CoA ligase subunit beta [Actinomyces sp. 186855]MCL3794362.1 ADP-forming succinate--CoA ligase subunit beta [Actinomyces sp. 217892]
MDLYEYQARDLLQRHGVPVLHGEVAADPLAAEETAQRLLTDQCPLVVVKAQVRTGGRGKAGGVRLARTPAQAREAAEAILGMDIKGHTVHRVLVTEGADIAQELYASFLLDRAERRWLALCSTEGGMDIETLAKERPEALARVGIDPLEGVTPEAAARITAAAGIAEPLADRVAEVLVLLWQALVAEDATLVEINPLAVTPDGTVLALDAKVSLDDNAAFRHEAVPDAHEGDGADPLEARAHALGLNYVRLEGEVGVLGNGAGLVMSTLDVVAGAGTRHGGVRPANFLDLGGGSSTEAMATGLELVASDPQVRAVLVNVFGGITSCDTVAGGVIAAVERLGGLDKPVVVRLDGNRAEDGRRMLAQAALPGVTVVDTMDGAADVVARLAHEATAPRTDTPQEA